MTRRKTNGSHAQLVNARIKKINQKRSENLSKPLHRSSVPFSFANSIKTSFRNSS